MKRISRLLFFILCLAIISVSSNVVSAEEVSKEPLPLISKEITPTSGVLLPNRAGKSLTTPAAWGASAYSVFLGAGMTTPSPYNDSADGAVSAGIGLGNPVKALGLQLSTTINDTSENDNYSYGFKVHRYLGYGTSVAFGGDLYPNKNADAPDSFYFVLSRASQSHTSSKSGYSKLHLNIGAGNGRFVDKSDLDKSNGKGNHGTYVFGSVAYEIIESTNVILEWNGINMAAGISTAPFEGVPLSFSVGAADLTNNSGDRVRWLLSSGIAYQF